MTDITWPDIEPSETEKAYLAGIVDGEGWIGISKMNRGPDYAPSYTGHVVVSMVDLRAIEMIAKFTSGPIHRIDNLSKGNRQDMYIVRFTSWKAGQFLRMIRSYLILKSRQADIVLELFDIQKEEYESGMRARRGVRLSDQRIAMREKLYSEIRELNRRGRRPEP